MTEPVPDNSPTRRDILRGGLRGACGIALTGLAATLLGSKRAGGESLVWQLDPYKCIQCGNCATHCVLGVSAVKCVHNYRMCGYCDFCTGYFEPQATELDTGAENQLCPTGALVRRKIEDERFEYTVDEDRCVGCGRCVKGCNAFGNGSLFLQVRHDLCVNCNECSIAAACPADAFRRVPAHSPYLLKGAGEDK